MTAVVTSAGPHALGLGNRPLGIAQRGLVGEKADHLAAVRERRVQVDVQRTTVTAPQLDLALGTGCARDTTVVSRAYGNKGNGPQLGVDIPMDVGGGLRFMTIYPNQTVWLYSMTGFNDVRSAFTAFRETIIWRDVPCP